MIRQHYRGFARAILNGAVSLTMPHHRLNERDDEDARATSAFLACRQNIRRCQKANLSIDRFYRKCQRGARSASRFIDRRQNERWVNFSLTRKMPLDIRASLAAG